MIDLSQLGGWIDDGGHEPIAQQLPNLAEIAPGMVGESNADTSTDPILLHKAWVDVLKAHPSYPAQQIGDCVSFGHAHANDLLQCIEIALGEGSEYRETATEFIYATSREVAGILGNRDGSYGSAAVKAMTTGGVLSREMLGPDGAYKGSRAKQWGRSGAPSDVKAKASSFKLGSAALVSDWDSLVAAMRNGYPVTICSNQGFSLARDESGFCRARGWWAHCMFISGIRFDRPGACICQSWGPDSPQGPTQLGQPSFSFWAERDVIERILKQGDSWALSKAADFVSRPIPKTWNWGLAA
jgi:hypothetical protein